MLDLLDGGGDRFRINGHTRKLCSIGAKVKSGGDLGVRRRSGKMDLMKGISVLCLALLCFALAGCGAAPPVAVGNKPVSINDQPLRDAPSSRLKPVGEMNWTTFDGSVQKLRDFGGKV